MKVSAMRGPLLAIIVLCVAAAPGAQEPLPQDELAWTEINNAPGSYSDTIVLRPRDSRELEYRFLHQSGQAHTDYFLPLTGGVELHAPVDSEVRYRIAMRRVGRPETTIVGEFQLDTLAPEKPRLTPPPGLHTGPISLVPGAEYSDDEIAVRELDNERSTFVTLPTDGLELSGRAGAVRDYRIAAYAVDRTGNRSAVAIYRYRIDRSHEAEPPAQPVASPQPGTYNNEQLLMLDDTGLTNVAVLLHRPGADPVEVDYRTMPTIAGSGEFRVSIEGTVRSSGEAYEHDVTWKQNANRDVPPQGRTVSTVRLRPPPARVRYTLEDRPVTDNDPFWLRVTELNLLPESTRTAVVRYRAQSEDDDTRLVYSLDARRAPQPQLARTEDPGTLSAYSLAETELQWAEATEEGITSYSEGVVGAAHIDISSITADRIIVRARFPGGKWTQRTIPVSDFRQPPVITPRAVSDDGITLRVTTSESGGSLTFLERQSGKEFLRFGGQSPLRWRPPHGFLSDIRSTHDESTVITVDRTPLSPPEIVVDGNQLRLFGEGQIFYRLDGSPDAPYENPLQLSGVSGAQRRYRVDAYRIADNRISPTATVYPVVDRRIPFVPEPQVIPGSEIHPGEFLSQAETTRIAFDSPYNDLELHYELTTEDAALLPRTKSPKVGDGILITTPKNQEVRWAVRVRGRFPGSQRWSPVASFVVHVDRQPPAPPVLASNPESTGVLVFRQPPEEDTSIWYRLVASAPYQRYLGPVTINRDRIENAVTVSAYARDTAGNRAELTASPVVPPLNQGPEPPRLAVNGRIPEEPHITRAREAVLEAVPPQGVRWRVIKVDSNQQNREFRPVSDPEILTRGTYRINAYRELGTERSRVVELRVTIDPERPRKPAPPHISYAPGGRSGTAYWSGPEAEQIFASIVTDQETNTEVEPFSLPDGFLEWSIPEGNSRVTLAYFSVGKSGIRSETEVLHLEAARSQPPPEISGVRDGAHYSAERTIELTAEGEIRFTLTTDGSAPPLVRSSSPLYVEPLLVRTSAGESTHYRLRFRTYEGDTPVSEEREISFVIDRDPPTGPQLQGATSYGHYAESRIVKLLSTGTGDTIMYRVSSDSGSPEEFSKYSGEEIPLDEDDTGPRHYQIDAYAIDRAGNRSTGIASWTVTIDATSLHVSQTSGDDQSGDGSRQAPLASLDAALRRIAQSSRTTVFLATGEYAASAQALSEALSKTASRPRGLILIGGHDPDTWLHGSDGTSLTVGDEDEMRVTGNLRLERLSLFRSLRFAPNMTADHLDLRHVEIRPTSAPGLVLNGGEVSLFDTTVSRSLEAFPDTRLAVHGSSLGAVEIDGGTSVINNSIIAGVRITGGAHLTVTGSRITADRSVDIGGLIYAEESTLMIRSSAVHSSSEDPILIRSRDAEIELEGSLIYGKGVRSVIAVRAHGGRLAISDSVLDVTSQGYGYGIFLRDTATKIHNSAVIVRILGDGVAVAAGNSSVSIDDSLLWISGVDAETVVTATGVSVDDSGVDDLVIQNSSILAHRAGERPSTAIRLGTDGAARITGNSFGGWTYTLIRSTAADTWERSGRLLSVEDLDRSHFGGENRPVETEAPPYLLRIPPIPNNPVPAALIELRRAGKQ